MRYVILIVLFLSGCTNSTDYASTAVAEHPDTIAYCYTLKQTISCIEPFNSMKEAEKPCEHYSKAFKETDNNFHNVITAIDKIKMREIAEKKAVCAGFPPEPETTTSPNDPEPQTQEERKKRLEDLNKDIKVLEEYNKGVKKIIEKNPQLYMNCIKQEWQRLIDYFCD